MVGHLPDWVEEFIQSMLSYYGREDLHFLAKRLDGLVSFAGRGSKTVAQKLDTIAEGCDDQITRSQISAHSCAMSKVVSKTNILSIFAPIEVTDSQGVSVTDIDGMSLMPKKNAIDVLLIEAKTQKSGRYSSAIGQLDQRLSDMGLSKPLNEPKAVKLEEHGAYVIGTLF